MLMSVFGPIRARVVLPLSSPCPPATSACPQVNRYVYKATHVLYCCFPVTSAQFKRWLGQQGCTFEPGHGGHLIVRRGDLMSVLPMHGSSKELGTGLVNKVKKDLGLKGR